jgi:hypothetical protein
MGNDTPWAAIFVILLFVLVGLQTFLKKYKPVWADNMSRIGIFIGIWVFISAVWNPDYPDYFRGFFITASLFIAYMMGAKNTELSQSKQDRDNK